MNVFTIKMRYKDSAPVLTGRQAISRSSETNKQSIYSTNRFGSRPRLAFIAKSTI